MVEPYIKTECDEYILYEYKTKYTYLFFVLLAIMLSGSFIHNPFISISGGIALAAYYFTVHTKHTKIYSQIKKAKQKNLLELTGSKLSFSNPLKVKILK